MSILAGKSVRFWFKASRTAALGQSTMPYLLGTLLALATVIHGHLAAGGLAGIDALDTSATAFAATGNGAFSLPLVLMGLVGVVLAHSGLNLLDDYFDYRKGAVHKRQQLLDGGIRARMGKCSYLEGGNLVPGDIARAATLFIVVALVLGAVVFMLRGWPVLVFAGLALVLGLVYAGPPLRLSYHGLGEIVVGLIFGPLVVMAAYYVALGSIDAVAIWASIPAGLLTINILNAHAIMDYEPDKAADRVTFVVLLGSKRAGFIASVVLVVLSYLAVGVAVALGVFTPVSLIVVLTTPMAFGYLRLMLGYLRDPDAPVVRRAWMGPMGNWELIRKVGIDWFMVRWCLARNLLVAFVLLLALANFIAL
jgi:1,4-dihydroxy-2-naphthoate octaprenyltransferase